MAVLGNDPLYEGLWTYLFNWLTCIKASLGYVGVICTRCP